MSSFIGAGVLLSAFLLDAFCGDPPNAFHPVAWMGTFIGHCRRLAPTSGNAVRFVYGIGVVLFGVTVVALIGLGVERLSAACPLWIAIPFQAVVLKSTFSARTLARAAESVRTELSRNDLIAARHQLAYHLVSRDVSSLDENEVSAAAIESVAENTSDSFVAPIFFFAIAGLPGALVYRYCNTCDAMLGYRTKELEWLGKSAARIDDLLNLIPARLTAIVMILTYGACSSRLRQATRIWLRDHRLTASPNAGHPMSAAAGVLGVELSKKGHYVLGAGQPLPDQATIVTSVHLLWTTCSATILLMAIGLLIVSSIRVSL